jgi:hypothetical protein
LRCVARRPRSSGSGRVVASSAHHWLYSR